MWAGLPPGAANAILGTGPPARSLLCHWALPSTSGAPRAILPLAEGAPRPGRPCGSLLRSLAYPPEA
ncbi:hypothetical protein NDU88_006950 [Pleurodeles waltl]|uniref:Uncharacterized protein n=1 Tax=Pleurodeles waltl TaxID=8319 RepID=A0AAV7TYB4_PLEWA|nr:hypothetical protein NDU88_006950 [Pleurodeles waltl]